MRLSCRCRCDRTRCLDVYVSYGPAKVVQVPQVSIQEVVKEEIVMTIQKVQRQVPVPQIQQVQVPQVQQVPVPQVQTVEKVIEVLSTSSARYA